MRLYTKYLSMNVKSQMQYKTSFWLMVLGQFLVPFSVFLGMFFLFQRFHTLAGFAYGEVLLCYAIVLMAFTLAEIFASGFDRFPQMLGNGMFDRVLVRPRGIVLQVLGSQFEFTRIGVIVQAAVMLAYAVPNSGVAWTGLKVLVLILMIFFGCILFWGLYIIYAAISFFTLEALEFMNIFLYGPHDFGGYPLVAYGKGILSFCTYIIPMALFQYYPLLYLLNRAPHGWYAALPLLCGLFLLPAYGLWRFGLRHYKSTGS